MRPSLTYNMPGILDSILLCCIKANRMTTDKILSHVHERLSYKNENHDELIGLDQRKSVDAKIECLNIMLISPTKQIYEGWQEE